MIRTKTRNPLCSVTVITHGGMTPVRIFPETISPSLLSVTTTRSIHHTAGTFTITLMPRPPRGFFGNLTWQDIISPLDYVTIRMWVPPNKPRIVMTGFVDNVVDTFSIAGGRPTHSIVVTGRDWGKLLLDTKLFLPDVNRAGLPQSAALLGRLLAAMDALTNGLKYRTYGALTGSAPPMSSAEIPPQSDAGTPAGTFIPLEMEAGLPAPAPKYTPSNILRILWLLLVKPQYTNMRRFFDGALPEPELTVDVDAGEDAALIAISPYMILQHRAYSSIWEIFRSFRHEPWRELYWDDNEDGPKFIYRSTPWLNYAGQLVQPAKVETVPIERRDLIDYSLGRSDSEIHNFFFTHPAVFEGLTQHAKTTGVDVDGVAGDPIFQNNPYLAGEGPGAGSLPESSVDYHRVGVRTVDATTPYIDIDPNLKESAVKEDIAKARLRGVEWNKKLKEAFNHGSLLETGTMTVQGSEALKVGAYLRLMPEGTNYYLDGVSHQFRFGTQPQDGHFVTAMSVSRGRGFLVRTQKSGPGL